jgi:hypothetical protein
MLTKVFRPKKEEISKQFRILYNEEPDHAAPLYPQELALTSPTSGGRSVGIVRSRTKATELVSYNEELRDLYRSPSAVKILKYGRLHGRKVK